MFKFCFLIIKWNYFERKDTNFEIECRHFDLTESWAAGRKFNELAA